MPDIRQILESLQSKKTSNDSLVSSVSTISPEALSDKIEWHAKVINYAIYFLVGWLALLTTLCYTGYLRLDDKIINESHFLTTRLDMDQRLTTQRLDDGLKMLREAPVASVSTSSKKKK